MFYSRAAHAADCFSDGCLMLLPGFTESIDFVCSRFEVLPRPLTSGVAAHRRVSNVLSREKRHSRNANVNESFSCFAPLACKLLGSSARQMSSSAPRCFFARTPTGFYLQIKQKQALKDGNTSCTDNQVKQC